MACLRVKCIGGTFRAISGRVGDFVFRAYQDETMLVFYQPKGKRKAEDVSGMDRDWTENASVMSRFKEMAKLFGLEVQDTISGNGAKWAGWKSRKKNDYDYERDNQEAS